MERGSVRERMQWVARLYDIDGDGFISVEELEDVIFSVSFPAYCPLSNSIFHEYSRGI